jgi:hypothetical protein
MYQAKEKLQYENNFQVVNTVKQQVRGNVDLQRLPVYSNV